MLGIGSTNFGDGFKKAVPIQKTQYIKKNFAVVLDIILCYISRKEIRLIPFGEKTKSIWH